MKLDKRGNVSFAVIAVLLLIGIVFVQVYMARLQMEENRAREEAREVLALRDMVWSCILDIRSHASFSAIYSLALSRQTGEDPESLFDAEMKRFTVENFPRTQGDRTVYIHNTSWSLEMHRAWLKDMKPALSEEGIIMDDGSRVSRPSAVRNTIIGNIKTPLAQHALGEFQLIARSSDMEIHDKQNLEIPLEALYPFLLDRMNILHGSGQGETSSIARTVQYILTTLAQYRVFQGMASPSSHVRAEELLSPWELEMAVNIAVYLEEIRAFRAVDPSSIREFDQRNMPLTRKSAEELEDMGTIRTAGERSLMSLMKEYVSTGSIDAADLFALFMCLDREPIAIDDIISQSLYTLLDQLFLQFMDYFSIPESIDPSTRDMTRFSSRLLGFLGIDRTVLVTQQPFDTGETATTFVNTTFHSNGYIQPADPVNSTLTHTGIIPHTSFPEEKPDAETLPVGHHGFYSSGDPWLEFFLDFSAEYDNATFLVNLDRRHSTVTGGQWENVFSVGGGGNGYGKDSFSKRIQSPYVSGGMEVRLQVYTERIESNSSINISFPRAGGREVHNGTWINKTILEAPVSPYYLSNSHIIGRSLQSHGILNTLIASFKDIVHRLLTEMVQTVSTMIYDVIFDGQRPSLTIEPGDDTSIIETMHRDTIGWTRIGFSRMRDILANEQRLGEVAEEIMRSILMQTLDRAKAVIDNAIANIDNRIGTILSGLITRICGSVNKIGGALADIIEVSTFGLISSDGLRDTVTSMVEGAQNYWNDFTNRVRGALEGIKDHIEVLLHAFANWAGEALSAVTSRVFRHLEGLVRSFLRTSRDIVTGMVDSMMKGGAIGAVDYRENIVKNQGDVHIGEFSFRDTVHSNKEAVVEIVQTPAYLSRADPGFTMEISEPEGIHHTDPFSISTNPYQTTWEVSVEGSFEVQVYTDTGKAYPESSELSEHSSLISLCFSVPVTIFSGWPLRGLEEGYDATRDMIGDLKNIFQSAWEKIASVFEGMLHYIKKAAQLLSRLIQEILSHAMSIVETLESLFNRTMTMLWRLLSSTGYRVASQLLDIFAGEGSLGPMTVLGYTFAARMEGQGLNISLNREEGFSVWAVLGEEDSSMQASIEFWHISSVLSIESLVNREYRGQVDWNNMGRGWTFEFYGPDRNRQKSLTLSLASIMGTGITVPTPMGTATIDIGLILSLDIEELSANMENEINSLGGAIFQGYSLASGGIYSKEGIQEAAEFSGALADMVLGGKIMDDIIESLEDISQYATLEFFVDVTLGAGGTGAGFTLSLDIQDPVPVINELGYIVGSTVEGLVQGVLRDPGSASGGVPETPHSHRAFAHGAWENIFVSLEARMGSDEIGRSISFGISANLPFFAVLSGREVESWMIDMEIGYSRVEDGTRFLEEVETDLFFKGYIIGKVW